MASPANILAAALGGGLKTDEPLAGHTTFGIGGPARAFFEARSRQALKKALALAQELDLPVFMLGAGSNVLFDDAGFEGLVITLGGAFRQVTADESQGAVTAGAGAALAALVSASVGARLTGLEFLAGIPGQVGGAVCMNAGAYGAQLADRLIRVEVLTPGLDEKRITRAQLSPVYRDMGLPRGMVVLEASFRLEKGDQKASQELVKTTLETRKGKHPHGQRSAGSVFKNPATEPAGALIERAGLKGARIGGAEISIQHANFIVNTGSATASDVRKLIQLAQREVARQCGVALEPEVRIMGRQGVENGR